MGSVGEKKICTHCRHPEQKESHRLLGEWFWRAAGNLIYLPIPELQGAHKTENMHIYILYVYYYLLWRVS